MKKLILSLIFSIISIITYSQCVVQIDPNDTILQICGTIDTLDVGNASVTPINNTFNNGSPGFGWAVTSSATFLNPCGTKSSTYLWMGLASTAPRTLSTIPINVSCGGTICFELKFAIQGQFAPCEGPDLASEGVYLEYRTFGGTWTQITYFQPNITGNLNASCLNCGNYTSWATYCYTIPVAAQTATTEFRWIQQASTTQNFDHWGLDSITITNNCTNVSHLWNTGDTTIKIGILSLYDSTYWCRRIINQIDTCYDTITVLSERPDIYSSVVPNIDVCVGAEVKLIIDSVLWLDKSVTYNKSWTPTSMLVSPNQDTTKTQPITQDTTFRYSISHPTYTVCSSEDSLRINLANNLFIGSPVVVQEYCNLSDGIISLNTYGGSGQYWYNINNIYNTNSFRTGLSSGSYRIHIKDTLTNCVLDTSVVVPFDIGIQIDSSIIDDILCYGDSGANVFIWTTNNYGNMTYKWYDPLLIKSHVSGYNNDSLINLPKGNYTIIVSDQKCDDTLNFSITEPDSLSISLSGNNTLCNIKDLELKPIISGGTPVYTINWFDTISPIYFIRGDQDTTIRLFVIDNNGCVSDTFSFDLFLPPAIVTDLRDTSICKGSTVLLDPNPKYGTGNYTFEWNTGWINQVLPTNNKIDRTYWVKVEDGCLYPHYDTSSVKIFYQPQAYLRWDPACLPVEDMIISTNNYQNNYKWYINGDTIRSQSNEIKIDVEPGETVVKWDFITDDECYVSGEDTIISYKQPFANFIWKDYYYDPVYNNTVTFYNISRDYNNLVWTFPKGTEISDTVDYSFDESGSYLIKLEAINGECVDDTIRRIEIKPIANVWVPNAFTPNKDNKNDIFKPFLDNVEEDGYEFYIYNRWGNLLFRTENIDEGWDGYVNGYPASDGVYVYLIKVLTKDRRFLNLKGTLTLLK